MDMEVEIIPSTGTASLLPNIATNLCIWYVIEHGQVRSFIVLTENLVALFKRILTIANWTETKMWICINYDRTLLAASYKSPIMLFCTIDHLYMETMLRQPHSKWRSRQGWKRCHEQLLTTNHKKENHTRSVFVWWQQLKLLYCILIQSITFSHSPVQAWH
jgi:hypothetical protein